MDNSKSTSNPNSPFNWRNRTEPSIFAQDPAFRTRKDGKTVGEVQTEVLNKKREAGQVVGYMHNLGKPSAEKEERILAYRQFGVFSKATPSKKHPNKHEE